LVCQAELNMIELFQDKKILVILGLIGVYLIYRFFLKEKNTNLNELEKEYSKVLNSDENKVKSQWD